jgi:hypothetical protein
MATPQGKLKLLPLMRLYCPYCGSTPLRTEGSWFYFRTGCKVCDYVYEREPGYFTGASWMVSYAALALSGCGFGALLLYRLPDLDAMWIAAIVSVFLIVFGLWFVPYSMAIWLGFDHIVHPLTPEDRYVEKKVQ